MSEIIISIDIGERNLGWTVVEIKQGASLNEFKFSCGVYDIKSSPNYRKYSPVLSRISIISEFVDSLIESSRSSGGEPNNNAKPEIKLRAAIIEEQVRAATINRCLMYCVATALRKHTDNIILFKPYEKFTRIKQQIDTSNKKHKQLSIENMKKITKHYNLVNVETELEKYKKKDDIADSFNQLIIQLIKWNLVDITFDELNEILNME